MDLSPRHLDTIFQALGDATRRALVERLSEGPATVSDLARPFDMALPSFLLHIRKLETVGLVETIKIGRTRTVTLVPGAFTPVRTWLDDQHALWEARLDRLETFVTTTTKGPET